MTSKPSLAIQSPAAVRGALPTPDGLANLVRRDGFASRLPMDATFCLETSAQRSRHTLAPGEQSLSGRAASLRSRGALSLPLRADWRCTVVETGTNRRMVACT